MELIPIKQHLHENKEFADNPDCEDTLNMTIYFFKRMGYNPPWIGYYVKLDGTLVGAAAFKGKPVNGKVEIAYGTFPQYQHKGIGKQIVNSLVRLSHNTDLSIIVTARTLTNENYSARILRKNNFRLSGTIMDEEEGEVCEWVYEALPYPPRKEGL